MTDNVADLSPLRPAQVRALALLAAGSTPADTARTCRVSRRTLSRWVNHDPRFRAALDRARKDQADAREAIRRMVTGEAPPCPTRFKACCVILGIKEEDLRGGLRASRGESRALRKFLADPRASSEW
jgi:hypothetical protein